MQRIHRPSRGLFAVLALFGAALAAGAAHGQALDVSRASSALALPIIIGDHDGNPLKDTRGDVVIKQASAVTLATVTNASSSDVLLKVDMISGDVDDGDTWQSTSFECELTGRETTTFLFTRIPTGFLGKDSVPGNSRLYVECSDDGDPEGAPTALFTGVQNGILFIAVADAETGEVKSEDVLIGDAVVIDTFRGQAYSFNAIGFQAGQGQNDGDKVYRFDGQEYAQFPAVLATNFIAPGLGDRIADPDRDVQAELILFTLDGTVGNLPVPRVKIGGYAYNDDEVAIDLSYEFDCFDVVALDDINANIAYDNDSAVGLGSPVGHLELVPQPIAAGFDAHDAEYGDSNGSRKRAVHGWLVQNVQNGLAGTVLEEDDLIDGSPDVRVGLIPAAWGRPLDMSTTSLVPFLSDDNATLDADTRN